MYYSINYYQSYKIAVLALGILPLQVLFSKINLARNNYVYSVGAMILYYELNSGDDISRAVCATILISYPLTDPHRIIST